MNIAVEARDDLLVGVESNPDSPLSSRMGAARRVVRSGGPRLLQVTGGYLPQWVLKIFSEACPSLGKFRLLGVVAGRKVALEDIRAEECLIHAFTGRQDNHEGGSVGNLVPVNGCHQLVIHTFNLA